MTMPVAIKVIFFLSIFVIAAINNHHQIKKNHKGLTYYSNDTYLSDPWHKK